MWLFIECRKKYVTLQTKIQFGYNEDVTRTVCEGEETQKGTIGNRVGGDGLYYYYHFAYVVYIYKGAQSRGAVVGKGADSDNDCGFVGCVSHAAMPIHSFVPHTGADGTAVMVVSRYV